MREVILMTPSALRLTATGWVFCVLVSTRLMGAEHYVASDGSDRIAGTRDSPWSLAKANTSAQPGDTVVLADGTYTGPIAPQHSGQVGKHIVYRATNPKRAVFTDMDAALELTGVELEECILAYVLRAHEPIDEGDWIAGRIDHMLLAGLGLYLFALEW